MWKSRMLFLYAYLSSALLILVYDDKTVGFTLIYALSFLIMLCFIQAITAPLVLKVTQDIASNAVFKGEQLNFTVKIKNLGVFFYPRLSVSFYNGEMLEYGGIKDFPLGPGRKTEIILPVVFPYRGVFETGVRGISATDFLGIFRFQVKTSTGAIVPVYPTIGVETGLLIQSAASDAVLNPDPYNEDYTSVADVRKYEETDSLKKIHWKLTAKRGELIVKNFQVYGRVRIHFAIDLRPIPGIAAASDAERAGFEDKMMSYLASGAVACLRAGLHVCLVLEYGRTLEVTPSEEPVALLETLAGLIFDKSAPPVFSGEDTPPENAVVFLSQMDEGTCGRLGELLSMGSSVFIYFFCVDSISPEYGRRLNGLAAQGAAIHEITAII